MPCQKVLLICLALISTAVLPAQSSDDALLKQFMQDEDYAKAKPLAKELWQKNYDNAVYYEYLLTCYVHDEDWSDAQNMIKKFKRKNGKNEGYEVDEIYIKSLETRDQGVFEDYVDAVPKTENDFKESLTALEKRKQTKAIVRLLERAEFIFGATEFFGTRLTNYYLAIGLRETALRRIVIQLESPFIPFDRAKNILEMNITDSSGFVMLRDILLQEIQNSPNSRAYNEILNWTFIQLQDWKTAYIFNKSLDKRLQTQGEKLYDLGVLCNQNLEFEYAAKCFEEVQKYGKSGPYFSSSLSGYIQAKYALIESKGDTQGLAQLYEKCLMSKDIMGNSSEEFGVIKTLGNIYISYKNDPEAADNLYEAFLNKGGNNLQIAAYAKIEQAKVLTLLDDVWTSELLYAQVEKDFGENPIGQEAKFYRAQLSYFRGDFEWANLQLNVLKAATTQLISNNAIELSLVITENLGLDSNYDALEKFAKAQLFTQQRQYSRAITLLDSISILYPTHSLADNILLQKGIIYQNQGKYLEAAGLFELLSRSYKDDVLADDALFKLGLLYLEKLNEPQKAKAAFEKIITEMSGSLYAIEARKYYRKLRGDNV
jgi:hypothetical protein